MYPNDVTSMSKERNNVIYRTINIEDGLYEKVAEIAKRRSTNLRKYVNDIMSDVIQREDFTSRILPFLKIVALDERSLFIKDQKSNHVNEVIIRNEKDNQDKFVMQCLEEQSDNCVHVAYALGFLASNDLGRLLH
jgi:predicted DNA-binding ribbon-helix-helix protein